MRSPYADACPFCGPAGMSCRRCRLLDQGNENPPPPDPTFDHQEFKKRLNNSLDPLEFRRELLRQGDRLRPPVKEGTCSAGELQVQAYLKAQGHSCGSPFYKGDSDINELHRKMSQESTDFDREFKKRRRERKERHFEDLHRELKQRSLEEKLRKKGLEKEPVKQEVHALPGIGCFSLIFFISVLIGAIYLAGLYPKP